MKKIILSLFAILLLSSCSSAGQNSNTVTPTPSDSTNNEQASSTHIFADGLPDRITFEPNLELAITSPLQRVSFSDNQWYFFTADNGNHNLLIARGTSAQFYKSCKMADSIWTEKSGNIEVQFCKSHIGQRQTIVALASLKGQMIMFSGVDLSVENIRQVLVRH